MSNFDGMDEAALRAYILNELRSIDLQAIEDHGQQPEARNMRRREQAANEQ